MADYPDVAARTEGCAGSLQEAPANHPSPEEERQGSRSCLAAQPERGHQRPVMPYTAPDEPSAQRLMVTVRKKNRYFKTYPVSDLSGKWRATHICTYKELWLSLKRKFIF